MGFDGPGLPIPLVKDVLSALLFRLQDVNFLQGRAAAHSLRTLARPECLRGRLCSRRVTVRGGVGPSWNGPF